MIALDRAVFHLVNRAGSWIVFDWSMPVISDLKYFIPAIVLLVAWMLVRDGARGRITVLCLAALVPLTDQVSSHLLKPAFQRPRPCREESGMTEVITRARCSGRGSFPSSHAANMGGVAVLLGWRYRRRRAAVILAALTAFGVGYSRVYLGVHYPSDVLGGWMLGAGLAAGIAWAGGMGESVWRRRRAGAAGH